MAVLATAVLWAPRQASAQEPVEADVALAETLFQEGKKLMTSGQYAEACPKLAESQRLDPGGGTLVTLALCHEAEGKTATAWAEFNEALGVAERDKHADRIAVCKEHLAAIEPRLSRLTVRVADDIAKLAGLRVERDGVRLSQPSWGVAAPLDPGLHKVRVEADGRRALEIEVTLKSSGDARSIDIVTLEKVAAEPPRVEPPRVEPPPTGPRIVENPPSAPWSLGRRLGVAAGGVGVAGIAVGAIFGGVAIGTFKDSNAAGRCHDGNQCDTEGYRLREASRVQGDVSTAMIIGGSTFVALGITLFAAWPSTTLPAAPRVTVSPMGVGVSATF